MELPTAGERIVRCLIGEPVDHVPFGIGLGWSPWGETLSRWHVETGNPDLSPGAELGFESSFVLPNLVSGIYPAFPSEVLEETEDRIVSRDGRGITLRARKDGGSIPEYLDYPVKTPEDWEHLKNERLRIDETERVPQDWDAFRAHLASTGEAVQVGSFPWGVFGSARDLMGVENTLIAFYEYPEMIRDIMDHLTSLWISLWEKVAAEVRIDHIHIWEDMSGKQGSLISPRMVEEFMMPCYNRMVAFGKSNNVRVISVDTDGDCAELVPLMMKHGINMFFPFEVQAGNDILEYRKLYPELGIIGGLDKRALAWGREAIDKEVKKAEKMIEQGRYVPAFDHAIPPDVSWDAFKYASECIRDLCGII